MTKIVFIWVGRGLPYYVNSSLEINLVHSNCEIVLVTNKRNEKMLSRRVLLSKRFSLVDSREFEEEETGRLIESRVLSGGKDFRQGFWVNTLKRLFVLRRYAERYGAGFFHAELDNVLFGLDRLEKQISSLSHSEFFVRDREDRAVLSIAYFKNVEGLKRLCEHIEGTNSEEVVNDMYIVGSYMKSNPGTSISLPNEVAFSKAQWPQVAPSQILGICDANAVGQFIGGLDFYISNRLFNRFVNENAQCRLQDCRFIGKTLDTGGFKLQVENGGIVYDLYNIHVHSKVLWWLRWKWSTSIILFMVNKGYPLPFISIGAVKERLRSKLGYE